MTPTKVELVSSWLPAQPWYSGEDHPALAKAGGFRLDDPAGEVGIEFMVACDSSGGQERWYHVPLTYRSAPLAAAADAALIGTAEHGVLGQRWIYDGLHDPVLAAQLLALIQGRAAAQAQSQSDTPDLTVAVDYRGPAEPAAILARTVVTGRHGTDLLLDTVPAGGGQDATMTQLTIRLRRVLEPYGDNDGNVGPEAGGTGTGAVSAGWTMPDGSRVRGLFAGLEGQ
jgi:hypothetical protein